MRVISGVLLAILLTCPRVSGAQTPTEPVVPPPSIPPRAFGEAGFARATYPKPPDATLLLSIDVGAGDVTSLGSTIPHPLVLNVPASAEGVTNQRR